MYSGLSVYSGAGGRIRIYMAYLRIGVYEGVFRPKKGSYNGFIGGR